MLKRHHVLEEGKVPPAAANLSSTAAISYPPVLTQKDGLETLIFLPTFSCLLLIDCATLVGWICLLRLCMCSSKAPLRWNNLQ